MSTSNPPVLIIKEGPEPGKQVVIEQAELVIGRDSTCELVLNTPVVSRRHCRIFLQGERYFIEDLGSSNGTFVNNQRLTASQLLADGDQIRLGASIHFDFINSAAVEPMADSHRTMMETSGTMLEGLLSPQAATVEGPGVAPTELSLPPQLSVSVAGGPTASYSLTAPTYNLGRAQGNEIVIDSPIVSGRHAVLEKTAAPQAGAAAYTLRLLPEAANPLYLRGDPLKAPLPLHDGDLLRIGSLDPEKMVTLIYHNPAELAERQLTQAVKFGEKNQVKIGRDPQNDVVLNNPTVSRFHALIERVGQRYRLRDLGSANGTFVNDERIRGDAWLVEGDQARIGAYRFLLEQDGLSGRDESSGVQVEVRSLNKWVRKDLNLLKDLSLNFNPREFIVVVGQSGGGKSTLVDAIAGYRPATHGSVTVNGVDIYKHFDSIRNQIGFVPQKDIIHMELTVYQALDYAAQLRMPADTSPEERRQRVLEVLHDLDLEHRQDVQISGLSGGQQKRVSIGVELLTRPGLFFLDEPTSGLDPGTETALMQLMRRLADQGRTIILITHATKNVMLADKVVFLARGGYLAWFGPPDEALKVFDSYRSEMDRRVKPMEFDDIYAILDDSSKGNPAEWAERYRQQPAYQRYIVGPLGLPLASASGPVSVTAPAPAHPATREPVKGGQASASGLRQLKILSARNIKILTRDRTSLILMLAAPVAIAMLDVVMALVLGRDLFDYQTGSMFNAITSFFMTLMYALLVGAYSQMREFVKESEIYKRERLVNLKALPYVSSKVWVALLLAIYQAIVFTGIHHLAYQMPGGGLEIGLYFVTMFLAILAGMMMGLFASALAPNANAAPLLVLLLVVPTLVMAGAMIPLPRTMTAISATRWAYQALIGISGGGADIAADACWTLPEEERDSLTLEDKAARGCTCMGLAIFDQQACYYPGLGAQYDPAIEVAEPLEPAAIGDPPAQPEPPVGPVPPSDPNDAVANAQFLLALQEHEQEVRRVSLDFEDQLNAYQDRAEQFKTEMEAYQKARAEWEIDRNSAVAKAEGLIKSLYADYSWTYVDKDDKAALWNMLLSSWGVLALISVILFGGILFLISRKS